MTTVYIPPLPIPKAERKKTKRTRELFKMVYDKPGKVRQRAILELQKMYKETNLKIWVGREVTKRVRRKGSVKVSEVKL
mgnify:CR=1 FL=1